jgi:hypothetical protein
LYRPRGCCQALRAVRAGLGWPLGHSPGSLPTPSRLVLAPNTSLPGPGQVLEIRLSLCSRPRWPEVPVAAVGREA